MYVVVKTAAARYGGADGSVGSPDSAKAMPAFCMQKICKDFFGMEPKKANERACLQDLPVPAYKLGGQRSPWLVDAKKLADYIDLKKKEAENDWLKMRA